MFISFIRKPTSFSILAMSLLVAVFVACTKQSEDKDVTVVSWGGQYQDELFNRWILPSAQEASPKISIKPQSYTGEYRNLTDMIESDSVTWDLVQVETFYAALAKSKGLLEPFDPPIDSSRVVPSAIPIGLIPYAYPTIGWSYAIAWNEKSLEAVSNSTPNTWRDFWDLKKFPGKRAMRDSPQGNIEAALLAAGLSFDEIKTNLYKNKDLTLLNTAFQKLDEIKDNVSLWWKSGDQIERELESGRSTLVATWNGRVWRANHNPLNQQQGTHIRISYQQAILDYDWWIIPKGAPNPAGAARLVSAMYNNINGSIAFATELGYGPPINGWDKSAGISDELRSQLPTTEQNIPTQFNVDPDFWAENYTYISERWREWMLR